MIRRLALAAFTLLSLADTGTAADARSHIARDDVARSHVAVGTLECRSPGGISLVVAFKEYDCRFYSAWGRAYPYHGRLTSLGLQAGITRDEVLVWRVYAPTNRVESTALRGNYAGAHAGAAFIVGLGANVLVGGSNRTISLQPVSVEAKTGFNFALAGSTFSLH
jgi:hypothetical protein